MSTDATELPLPKSRCVRAKEKLPKQWTNTEPLAFLFLGKNIVVKDKVSEVRLRFSKPTYSVTLGR